MEIVKDTVLDLLPVNEPKLSATSDMPVIETHPDSLPKPDAPAAEVKEEAKPEESAPPVEATEDSSAAPDEAKKPAKGVQKRIDELTRQREDAIRRAEANEARLDRLLGVLEKGPVKEIAPGVEDKEPVKPQENDFSDPRAYDAAHETYVSELVSYKTRQEVKKHIEAQQKKVAEEAQAAQMRQAQESFAKRVETAKQKYPDWQQVAESPDVQVSFPIAHAISNSEQGPDIQYYFGQHPAEAKRISAMTVKGIDPNTNQLVDLPDVARQLVEFGRIAEKLAQPAPASKPVSAAPKPISPIQKTSEVAKTPDEESMEEYAARRKTELNSRRPGVRH